MVQGESLRRESMALAAVKYSKTWLVLHWPRGSRLAGSRWSWRRYSTPPPGWSYLGPWGVVEKGVDGLGGSEVLHHEAYLGPGGGESLSRESMALAAVKYSTTWLCENLVFFTGTFFLQPRQHNTWPTMTHANHETWPTMTHANHDTWPTMTHAKLANKEGSQYSDTVT